MMDLLSRFERALEDMVEGVFSRAFRTTLQPIEIAKRLTRELESHRAVSVSATYVPNSYTVQLAPETHQSFTPISTRLLAELEQYLREFITERKYQVVGPVTVRLVDDPTVKVGDMQVALSSDPQAVPSVAVTPPTLRSVSSVATARPSTGAEKEMEGTIVLPEPAAALEIVSGEGTGRIIPLTDNLTIGRGNVNTLALTDPGASRRHAEIVLEDEGWVLRDLGSTNGTFVNGRRITTHTLRTGEIVKIGGLTLKVK